MPNANDYHFITHWRASGATLREVYDLIADAEALPQWWPAVYLAVTEAPGQNAQPNGIGRAFDLYTKGWLPYTLRWRMRVRALDPPHGLTIGAEGDFVGRGIWTFVERDGGVDITFDWKLAAEKPLLRLMSPLLKPAFSANHRWAMQIGETSLRSELERRRGATAAAPPGPTTWQPWAAFGVLALLIAGTTAALIASRSDQDASR